MMISLFRSSTAIRSGMLLTCVVGTVSCGGWSPEANAGGKEARADQLKRCVEIAKKDELTGERQVQFMRQCLSAGIGEAPTRFAPRSPAENSVGTGEPGTEMFR